MQKEARKTEVHSTHSVNIITVNLPLPTDLLSIMNIHQTSLPSKLKELIVLELFREGLLSTGKAAELLDMPKVAFITRLTQNNIDYFSESPAELSEQISQANALLKKELL